MGGKFLIPPHAMAALAQRFYDTLCQRLVPPPVGHEHLRHPAPSPSRYQDSARESFARVAAFCVCNGSKAAVRLTTGMSEKRTLARPFSDIVSFAGRPPKNRTTQPARKHPTITGGADGGKASGMIWRRFATTRSLREDVVFAATRRSIPCFTSLGIPRGAGANRGKHT